MPSPNVMPDAKPAFLARYFWPRTVIGPYCENTPKAIGIMAPKNPHAFGTKINTNTDGKNIILPKDEANQVIREIWGNYIQAKSNRELLQRDLKEYKKNYFEFDE